MIEDQDAYKLPRYRMTDVNTSQNNDFPNLPGIYFIFKREKIVYVGRSNNIRLRLAAHCSNRFYKTYMMAAYLVVNENIINDLEKQFIEKYEPPLNRIMYMGTPYHITYTKEEKEFSQFRLECKLIGEKITKELWQEWKEQKRGVRPEHYSWALGAI